jgi:hypothetical protein
VLIAGIAPHGSSIVLSGGYADDEDFGDVIIYTGEGGRDQNTRRQIADQQFIKGNKALAENHLNGIPIRVHREKAHWWTCQKASITSMTVITALQNIGRSWDKRLQDLAISHGEVALSQR